MMICTQGLRFAYPQGASLAFPDLSVAQGETLLLRGASGSGKSTWLALVAGLLLPHAGHIAVAGQDLSCLSVAQRDAWRAHHLGFLPQRLHLSEALDVRGNLALAYFAAGRAVDQARMQQVLDALSIAPLASRKPSRLSGGQAQRVAIARAVLLSPRVIVADEPTASLDDESAEHALHLLRHTAKAAGATLVIATHDARVAQALHDAQACELPRLAALGDRGLA